MSPSIRSPSRRVASPIPSSPSTIAGGRRLTRDLSGGGSFAEQAHGELEPPPMRSTSATMRPCPQEPAPAEETLEDRQVVHRPSASFRRPLGASRERVPLRRTASDRKTPLQRSSLEAEAPRLDVFERHRARGELGDAAPQCALQTARFRESDEPVRHVAQQSRGGRSSSLRRSPRRVRGLVRESGRGRARAGRS